LPARLVYRELLKVFHINNDGVVFAASDSYKTVSMCEASNEPEWPHERR
jgi:hypothetical protein